MECRQLKDIRYKFHKFSFNHGLVEQENKEKVYAAKNA